MAIPPLAGSIVGVTADRRCEEQVMLLERRGASTMLGATVRTLPLADDEALSAALESVISDPPEITVLLTGIGARGMFAAAEGMGRDGELLAVLSDTRVIARGPKSAGSAATAGLDVAWQAPGERSIEILEHLRGDAIAGARIVVQRDGQREAALADALAVLGADAVDVPVYRWEIPDDTRPALRLIAAIVDRAVDAVTFTSSPAVRHLVDLATEAHCVTDLFDAFSTDVTAACVGPVCGETARDLGIANVVVPNRARLGAMVQALAAQHAERARTISTFGAEVVIQGRAVFVDGEPSILGARERAVLEVLADARGAVVPKPRLLQAVWGPAFDDDHAVEVAVGRLRKGLGVAGNALETVARRGYRFAS